LTNYSDFSDFETSQQQVQNLKKQYGSNNSNEPEEIDITAYEIFTSDKDKQTQNILDCTIYKNSTIKAKSTAKEDDKSNVEQEPELNPENEYIKMYKAKKDSAKVSAGKDGMLRSSLSDEYEHIDLSPDQKLQ